MRFLRVGVILLGVGTWISTAALACQWPRDTRILDHGTSSTLEFTDGGALAVAGFPADGALERYRRSMVSRLDTDPRDPIALLRRQRRLFEAGRMYHELPVYDRIIAGTYGAIRPISCLEGLLYEYHLTQRARAGRRGVTEFLALLLRQPGGEGGLRVLFAASDSDGGAYAAAMMPSLRDALATGWRFEATLHNHPFAPSRPDIVGTTIPSAVDEATSRSWSETYGLRRMVITNGFSTWEVPTRDLYSTYL